GQAGITLVEVLVVMVILSIALSIVAPSISNGYERWSLRSTGRRVLAVFRSASYTARRDGFNLAGYYQDHRLVLVRDGSVVERVEIPDSITVRQERSGAVIFLSSGQIIGNQEFVLENGRGRRVRIRFGPIPGQLSMMEEEQ
ncbi:MAG: type II secretion system protein, partial [Acidobacteria bacterium]|nr:type II secretion system protein [Acidobacteriota bacterium]